MRCGHLFLCCGAHKQISFVFVLFKFVRLTSFMAMKRALMPFKKKKKILLILENLSVRLDYYSRIELILN